MELPAFMAPIEEWMRAQETLAEQLTTILLSSDSVWVILANLIVIAVTAGITEEFLFRGALQRVIGKWTSNPHTIIWVAAILPFTILRILAPDDTRSLFRLSTLLEQKHLDTGVRPLCQ